MIRRHEPTDSGWVFMRPLPPRTSTGLPRLDDRTVLNGIARKFRAGVDGRGVPERYGSRGGPHTRFRHWATDGTCDRMLQSAQARADAAGNVDWLVSVDSSTVRAHRCPLAPAARGGHRAIDALPMTAWSSTRCGRGEDGPAGH
ncbi:transposase [Streptomyces sp. PanSC19]|nr:transposase [Streptomyces sp. PanSC19]